MKQFQTLSDVRAEIDEIDAALVQLLKRRFNAIIAAPEFKSDSSQARIPSRVDEVEANVRRVAREVGFPEERAASIWQFMMDECIAYEHDVLSERIK